MAENKRPIVTGLCAFGMSGRMFQAPFLHAMDEFSLHAVVERHAKRVANTYPDIRSYDSVEAMLADPAIELVVVNTPNVDHFEHVRMALLAGKHVVVEKPFSVTSAQAAEMVELAARQDRKLVAFQNRRWDSDFLAVREVVEKGLLGQLIEAEFHYDRYEKNLSAKAHKEVDQLGTGVIYDLGPHLIDQAICLFGRPERVFAVLRTHRPGSVVNDYFDLTLLYGAFTVRLKSSLLALEPVPGFVVHGTEGSFLKSRADVQADMLDQGISPNVADWGQEPTAEHGVLHTCVDGHDERRRYPSPAGSYQTFFAGVYRHVREGAPAPVALADTLLNVRIIEAALESSRTRAVVALG
ncbi:Gfo/Idh/MocA family oxidoreductase [Rhodanobacter ginsenosidimutans]|uniref:Gfo/Idh/MocA family oxidoreductase n=1 Tax=Rhodanobacter ginsenosidimutans TaxID=490571 RepID=A0ABW0JV21_9GAMM